MIGQFLEHLYTAHPFALLAFGFVAGVCAGFLVGVRHEARWWRSRIRPGQFGSGVLVSHFEPTARQGDA